MLAIVRETAQFRKSEAGGKLISIPSGDGMALVFFQSPEEPVQCALEISRVLKNHPRLQLQGYGGLIVCRNARNLIRTLPAMTYDRTNVEDIDPACEEHAVKALMYGLTRRKISCQLYKVRGI